MKSPIDASIMEQARTLRGSIEDLLAFLRNAGVSQMRSSLALAELTNLSPSDAKQCVIESKVWKTESERVVDLHDQLATEFGVAPKIGPRP